jgi:ParB/RepB/Spo0J family partition protein
MAIRINAAPEGEKVQRGEMFFIDPMFVQVNESLNGRAFPHDEDAIERRCNSFEKEGQLQPVIVRRIDDNRVQLVLGYCRYAAAVMYNKRHPDKPMKLKCVVSDLNEEEAFRKNIVENRERQETTPIDDAFNQRRLREEFGYNDSKIAEFYNCTPSYVSQLKKLLQLEPKIQLMVHRKEFAFSAALALADLPPEEREQALVEAADKGTSTASITKAVREKKIEKGKGHSRSLKEVRSYFEELSGPAEKSGIKSIAELMLKFISGRIKEETMTNRLNSLFPDEVVEQDVEKETAA